MSKGGSRLSRLGVLAPAALSACIDASVMAAPAAGAILSTVLKELSKAFMLKKWFHGVMSSKEAEQLLLQKGKHGSYMVRESRTHPGEYVLSVRVRTRVAHVMIRKEQNKYHVGSGEIFEDLSGLIEHCRAYPLREASGEVLRLRQPVSGARVRSKHRPEEPTTKKVAVRPPASLPKRQGRAMETNVFVEMLEMTDDEMSDELADEANDPDKYEEEFNSIKRADAEVDFTTIEGRKPENRKKNRYENIVPYDQTRVPLPRTCSSPDDVYTDYINASYVRPRWMFNKMLAEFNSFSAGKVIKMHSSDWEDLKHVELRTRYRTQPVDPKAASEPGQAAPKQEAASASASNFAATEEAFQIWNLRRDHQTRVGVVNDKFYIATQGCLATTKYEFWCMIIDNDVRVICMIAECVENGMIKCEQYWPPIGGTEIIRDIKISHVGEHIHPYYIARELVVTTAEKKSMTVYQYQYQSWPDHSVPSDIRSILRYIRDVNERMKMVAADKATAPKHNILCVHCSAGIGRTGTFIALDMLVDIAKIDDELDDESDILTVVRLLRKQRPGMVNSKLQYKFLYDAAAKYLEDAALKTAIPPHFSF